MPLKIINWPLPYWRPLSSREIGSRHYRSSSSNKESGSHLPEYPLGPVMLGWQVEDAAGRPHSRVGTQFNRLRHDSSSGVPAREQHCPAAETTRTKSVGSIATDSTFS
jgi:hypothetical protein